ncbi:hypothetical protein BDC45DRAFT_558296 [Circinella umbellata]|nr:hypothetical protein BDC45DRAFT_558296 [Circinella umbellata]
MEWLNDVKPNYYYWYNLGVTCAGGIESCSRGSPKWEVGEVVVSSLLLKYREEAYNKGEKIYLKLTKRNYLALIRESLCNMYLYMPLLDAYVYTYIDIPSLRITAYSPESDKMESTFSISAAPRVIPTFNIRVSSCTKAISFSICATNRSYYIKHAIATFIKIKKRHTFDVINLSNELNEEDLEVKYNTIESYANTNSNAIADFEAIVLQTQNIPLYKCETHWRAEHMLRERWDNRFGSRAKKTNCDSSSTTALAQIQKH